MESAESGPSNELVEKAVTFALLTPNLLFGALKQVDDEDRLQSPLMVCWCRWPIYDLFGIAALEEPSQRSVGLIAVEFKGDVARIVFWDAEDRYDKAGLTPMLYETLEAQLPQPVQRVQTWLAASAKRMNGLTRGLGFKAAGVRRAGKKEYVIMEKKLCRSEPSSSPSLPTSNSSSRPEPGGTPKTESPGTT